MKKLGEGYEATTVDVIIVITHVIPDPRSRKRIRWKLIYLSPLLAWFKVARELGYAVSHEWLFKCGTAPRIMRILSLATKIV